MKANSLFRDSTFADPSVNKASLRAPGRLRRYAAAAAAALALGAGAAPLAGCVATVGTEGGVLYGYPVARTEIVPVEITTYPRVYYQGRYAYFVNDRWYYPSDTGWVVFREEPVELKRHRTEHRRSPRYVPPPRHEYSYPRERPRTYTPR
jgi:hypothetical protein